MHLPARACSSPRDDRGRVIFAHRGSLARGPRMVQSRLAPATGEQAAVAGARVPSAAAQAGPQSAKPSSRRVSVTWSHVRAVGRRGEDVDLVRSAQVHGEDDARPVGRPARIERRSANPPPVCRSIGVIPVPSGHTVKNVPPAANRMRSPSGDQLDALRVHLPRRQPCRARAVGVDDEQGDVAVAPLGVLAGEHVPVPVRREVTREVAAAVGVRRQPLELLPVR